MAERDIAKHLKRVVVALGGEVRKVRWEGRAHAPDYFVMLYRHGKACWVETKAPGENARAGQQREHDRMRRAGCEVHVLDTEERIEEWAAALR
jgi:hypothetical protein